MMGQVILYTMAGPSEPLLDVSPFYLWVSMTCVHVKVLVPQLYKTVTDLMTDLYR